MNKFTKTSKKAKNVIVAASLIAYCLLPTANCMAQAGVNYQAIARDSTGAVLSNTVISIRASILSGSTSGTLEWEETHADTTNQFGLFNLVIGQGIKTGGAATSIAAIAWGDTTHYLKIEMDPAGGTVYILMGTEQILTVPYAFFANNSDTAAYANSSAPDADADSTNELQTLSLSNDTLNISSGNSVILTDTDLTNELQTLSLSNDTLNISSGNSVILTDSDPTNELQNFSISGDTLFISNSNFVIIPGLFDANFVCGTNSVQDADGNWYQTVQIGTQCWMAENLNVGTYVPVVSGGQTNNFVIQKYCQDLAGFNDTTCPFGGLYEWGEAVQYLDGASNSTSPTTPFSGNVQGVCPTGWHLPTHDEWTTLERAVCTSGSCATDFPFDVTTTAWRGTDEGGKMKVTPICGTLPCWNTPNTGATNTSNFNALPGGNSLAGAFNFVGTTGFWWTAAESSAISAWFRSLSKDTDQVLRLNNPKMYGYSVRCVKD
ncbi:MAG: hypothetical protein FVQ77_00965 [Cytophagales bacterium]|nr:hypothetical protein [Cytophagales bacterium]